MEKKRYISLYLVLLILTLFVFSLLYVKDVYLYKAVNHVDVYSEDGVWDLSDIDFENTIVSLSGDVQYIENEILTPTEFHSRIDEVKVGDPVNYNSGNTAKLTCIMPDNQRYGLLTVSGFARRIYINNELVGEFGTPATNEQDYEAGYGNIYTAFIPQDNIFEIVIQGANFVHREGSSFSNTLIGYPLSIEQSEVTRTAIETFLFGFLFVLFIIHIMVSELLGNKALNRAFAFVCLFFAVRLSLIGTKVWYDFFPSFSWDIGFRLEYISVSVSSILLMYIVYLQFKPAIKKSVVGLFMLAFLILTALYIFTHTIFVSHLMIYATITYILALLYSLISIIVYYSKNGFRTLNMGQTLSFISLAVLVFASVNDGLFFLNINILGIEITLTETSILIFSLYQTISILHSTTKMVENAKRKQFIAETQAASLENLNKMKSEFMQNMSHEMKTPLTVISTGTEYSAMQINKEKTDKSEVVDSLNIVKDETERLGRMVSGMVNMISMVDAENRQKISIYKIIDTSINSLKLMCEHKGNIIQSNLQEDLPPIFVDFDSFLRVLSNIITNAHQHTKDDIIKIDVYKSLNYVYITISDNGSGIPPELINEVTKRGVSGKDSSGYGLYICKTIVEAHGGELKIDSEFGEGTSVTVTVPVYAGQEEGHN